MFDLNKRVLTIVTIQDSKGPFSAFVLNGKIFNVEKFQTDVYACGELKITIETKNEKKRFLISSDQGRFEFEEFFWGVIKIPHNGESRACDVYRCVNRTMRAHPRLHMYEWQ